MAKFQTEANDTGSASGHDVCCITLTITKLDKLMSVTEGVPAITVALLDGPIAVGHPDLISSRIRGPRCSEADSAACMHGTFLAGILSARRGSAGPSICPGCTLFVRPIFSEHRWQPTGLPQATPDELAEGIVHVVKDGARILNLSVGLPGSHVRTQRNLVDALDLASRSNVLVVAAAGNQGTIGTSTLLQHPVVVPVAACDLAGQPMRFSNLGRTISQRGLSAPGDRITSIASNQPDPVTWSGTSFAAPFVSGAAALLWSEFPSARAPDIRLALLNSGIRGRTRLIPPVMDAWTSYLMLRNSRHPGNHRGR